MGNATVRLPTKVSKADTVIKACELNRKGQAKYFFQQTPTLGTTHRQRHTQADRDTR